MCVCSALQFVRASPVGARLGRVLVWAVVPGAAVDVRAHLLV